MVNRSNGTDRAAGGRFAPGNQAAKGRRNRDAEHVGQLRRELMDAITPEAIRRVVEALIREAESGNVTAIRELLDRAIGKPVEADLIERIEQLELQLNKGD